jgi:hypothetical protein
MAHQQKKRPVSPYLVGAEQALKRAALRAREIAKQTNTACIARKNGQLIDTARE